MNENELLMCCAFAALPVLDLFRVYMINLCYKKNQERRNEFLIQKEELILAKCLIGTKAGNQVLVVFSTFLRVILLWKYHYTSGK
jgi:hypothetical protein